VQLAGIQRRALPALPAFELRFDRLVGGHSIPHPIGEDRGGPHLLCIDEVGYLSYDSRYADLLFEVVTRRYDTQKPVLLSTNKAFTEWSEVFPHAACVVTLVDRLIHRAEVIDIDAESYRLKEAKELNAARTTRRRTKKH
jgi:hypothetical protein